MRAHACQILIFSTIISNTVKAGIVLRELLKSSGIYDVHIDLDDWEHVLRMECDPNVQVRQVEEQVALLGFKCAGLPD